MKSAIRTLILALAPVLGLSPVAGAVEKIQSDCKYPELAILRHKTTVEQISPEAKVANLDCTVVKGPGDKPKLVVLYVLNAVNGVETYLVVFARDHLMVGSKPSFKSESIGFDSFAILAKRKHRLLYVPPPAAGNSVFLYTNTQTAANATVLKKWELSFINKSLNEVPDATYPMDSTKQPKILEEGGKARAILNGKMIDL